MSMMAPDMALVAEVMLFAVGFSDAARLARKATTLYRIASEQLSQQVRAREAKAGLRQTFTLVTVWCFSLRLPVHAIGSESTSLSLLWSHASHCSSFLSFVPFVSFVSVLRATTTLVCGP
jgi:hypothetical protein